MAEIRQHVARKRNEVTKHFCLSHFLFFHVYMSVVGKDLHFPQTVLLSVDGTSCVW
jgi:hypothetical protein